jgi:hypothetical protein
MTWFHVDLLAQFSLTSDPFCAGRLEPIGRLMLAPTRPSISRAMRFMQVFRCRRCDHLLFACEEPEYQSPTPIIVPGLPGSFVGVGCESIPAIECSWPRRRKA